MITKLVMPKLNMTMRSGTIMNWIVKEGASIRKDEPVCEIEGDKAVTEILSPVDGFLLKIVAEVGSEIDVQETLAYIGNQEDNLDEFLRNEEITSHSAAVDQMREPTAAAAVPQEENLSRIKASPLAKRLAKELGVDLGKIVPSSADGVISRDDVIKAQNIETKEEIQNEAGQEAVRNAFEQPAVSREIKVTGLKKIIAERMKQSYLDAPHFSLSISAGMAIAETFLIDHKGISSHLTYTDLVAAVVSRTLVKHPLLNASLNEETITVFADVNIGVAVSTDNGLVVPVIKMAHKSDLKKISEKREQMVKRARKGDQTPEDLSQGTFTISNLGMFGIESFSPIIFPGQAGILGMGNIHKTVIVSTDGSMMAVPLMNLTLVCDHRIVDGAEGAKFLADVKTMLEDYEALKTLLKE